MHSSTSFRLGYGRGSREIPLLRKGPLISVWTENSVAVEFPRVLWTDPLDARPHSLRADSFPLPSSQVKEGSIVAVQIFDQRKFKRKDQGFLGVINIKVSDVLDLELGGHEMLTKELKKSGSDNSPVHGKLIVYVSTNTAAPITNPGPTAGQAVGTSSSAATAAGATGSAAQTPAAVAATTSNPIDGAAAAAAAAASPSTPATASMPAAAQPSVNPNNHITSSGAPTTNPTAQASTTGVTAS